ncbi:MAG: Fe-S cluster assembly protein SufD [Chthonomonas sp.]
MMANVMTTEGPKLARLLESAPGGPEWLQRLRDEGRSAFLRIGIPTSKHEEWKYTNLRDLAELEFTDAPQNAPASPWDGTESEAGATFENGRLVRWQGAKGVTIEPIAECIANDCPGVREHLGQYARPTEHPFVALNTAVFEHGVVVRIAKDAQVEKPIHLRFVNGAADRPYVTNPRVLVVAERGSEAFILESHYGEGVYFANPVFEVKVEENAHLEHVKVQQESSEAFHIATIEGHQEANSVYHTVSASFGARLSRNDWNVYLNGQNVETRLYGAYVGMGEQVSDQHTRLDHAQPNCNSFEVYKGILGDRASGVFNGKIFVHQDAQKTDAKQTNQALLLSPTATIDTKPQLEIYADDVKCTHGATVGQLEEEALFYLRARGIPFDVARSLLTYAFASEVLDHITHEQVRDQVERALYEKLGGGFPA